MKKFVITIFFATISIAFFGQSKPDWLDNDLRNMKFPPNVYLTGFVYRALEKGVSAETSQAKLDAQADLVKQIRLILQSKTQTHSLAQSINGKYDEVESFENQTSAETNAEIVGIKTETYFDEKSKLVYAFAYANKYELIGYYKSNLSVNINQIESFIKTAQGLESNNEKSKARQQLEQAKPLFSKVRYAQGLLIAVDANAAADDLQQTKSEQLYNSLTQMQVRLAQAVFVHISGKENLFGKSENIIANKVKADLAHKGCSFVDNAEKADFRLKINANVRLSSQSDNLIFCYADVEIELFDNHKQKAVFGDSFSEKSGSSSQEKAGRKAMEDAANIIAEKITKWLQ